MSLKGVSVLVTGAGGFIGSHLTERLVQEGANVKALVHYNALGSAGWLDFSPLRPSIDVIWGDVCDSDSIQSAMENVTIVFHLGALISIPYSYRAPASYLRTNIEGTLNVLQSARNFGVERLVHTSTSEVYGTALSVPIDENHPLQGQSPYSATKIAADKLAESFYLSFQVPVVIVRPFNTFGPRQSVRAVIPTIITQCLSRERVMLGKLSPTRDLNYVENTVDGFIKAAVKPDVVGQTVNLGSGREICIGDLARLIGKLTGRSIKIESEENRFRPKGSEVERLLANNEKAKTLLNWAPKITLEEGLEITINWFKDNLSRYQIEELRL